MTVRSKSKNKPHASTTVEPFALSPDPAAGVAPPLAVRETSEKPGAPAFDSACDTSASYTRLVHWFTSGADGGRRSFLATARHYGVDESTIREQAKRGRWLERAATCDLRAIDKQLAEGTAVQRRAASAQVALSERLTRILERAVAAIEDMPDDEALATIEPALEAVKGIQRIAAVQRLASGLSTSNKSVQVNVKVEAPDMSEFDNMSPEEILLADALERAKLKRLGVGHG